MNKLNTITFFLSILVGLFFIGPVITTAEENYFIAPKNVSQPAVRVIKGLLRVIQHKSVDDPGLFISEALRTQIMEPFQYDGFGLTGLAVDRDIDIDSAAGHKGVGGVILLIDVNSRTATFSFDAEYRTQGGNLTVLSAILRDKVLQPPAAVAVFTPADSVDAAPYAKAGDYSGLIAALTQRIPTTN